LGDDGQDGDVQARKTCCSTRNTHGHWQRIFFSLPKKKGEKEPPPRKVTPTDWPATIQVPAAVELIARDTPNKAVGDGSVKFGGPGHLLP